MRHSLIAIVLCVFAAAADAHLVARASASAAVVQPAVAREVIAEKPMEVIKTSVNNTGAEHDLHDGPPVLREAAPAATGDGQQPRRAGPVMVLAVVAVMSGIALRRYGSRMR